MVNRTFIFLSIFFYLITFNLYSDEQISFDVTEIEILDGGNKIIGKNRGIINSNNEITIEADEFEFDKTKNILQAKGNILIKDRINEYNFSAQDITYDINEERIELQGKAKASDLDSIKFVSRKYNYVKSVNSLEFDYKLERIADVRLSMECIGP